jgi:signal transduction histidine kinase
MITVMFNKETNSIAPTKALDKISEKVILRKIDPTLSKNKMQKELEDLIDSNSQFISIIAHDLRGPFSTVIGFLSLLKLSFEKGKPDENQQFLDLASKSAQRAVDLLDELTSWALSQTQGEHFNPENLNVSEVLKEEIEALISLSCQKRLEVAYSFDSELTVRADREMLKTIVRNLLRNSAKFTPEGGSITLTAKNTGASTVICVEDTGVGISKNDQQKLLNEDTRHSTYGTNFEMGTGLGLRICKHFIDIHQGTLQIRSTVGKGSIFKVCLPHKAVHSTSK